MGGLAGGLAWGVIPRLWMRFISTNPEFTWSGTLFIVIGFGSPGWLSPEPTSGGGRTWQGRR